MSKPITYKHAVWSVAFLSATGLVVAMEVAAAITKSEDIAPWTEYLCKLPKPVSYAAAAIISTWLPLHVKAAYQRRGK